MVQTLDKEKLARAIKTKRLVELDITLREAAKKSKVTFSTLSRMENKQNADLENLLRVSSWLNIPLAEFVIVKNK